jgi:hypothetical protein
MFVCWPLDPEIPVIPGEHSGDMADLFAIVGLVTVSLLGVARWWEEH